MCVASTKELLLVMTNEKLPLDTRIIVVDPMWCPDEEVANRKANHVEEAQLTAFEWIRLARRRGGPLAHTAARCSEKMLG